MNQYSSETIRAHGVLSVVRDPFSEYSPAIFPHAHTQEAQNEITLVLGDTKGTFIRYPKGIDDIVKNWQQEQIIPLYVAFREYELRVFKDFERLQERVIRVIERSAFPLNNAPQAKIDERVIQMMEELFKAGDALREGIEGKEIVLLIGGSGVGKSTAANQLSGCTMKSVSETLFCKESLEEENFVVIAEKSVVQIGQTGDSETLFPEVIIPKPGNETENFYYCDLPGFRDSRPIPIKISNALSTVDAVNRAESIKAILLFCNYQDIKDSKYDKLKEDIEYLQMFLQDFSDVYVNNFKFVCTKFPPNLNRKAIPSRIETALRAIIRNSADKPLIDFCTRLLELEMHKKIIFCDPINPENKQEMIQSIRACTSIQIRDNENRPHFGYPIDHKTLLKIEELYASLSLEVKDVLKRLKTEFERHWNARIESAMTSAIAKDNFDHIKALAERNLLTASYFAEHEDFAFPSQEELQKRLTFWKKVEGLKNELVDINVNLADSLDIMMNCLEGLIDEAENVYYNLIYEEFARGFRLVLRSSTIQRNVLARKRAMADLENIEKNALIEQIGQFFREAEQPVPHADMIDVVLTKDPRKCALLKGIIQQHIMASITTTDKTLRSIQITSAINSIALSQVIEEIGEEQIRNNGHSKELVITVKTPNEDGIFYLDRSLEGDCFRGKTVIIVANRVDVLCQCRFNLSLSEWRGGTFLIKSSFKGTVEHGSISSTFDPADGDYTPKFISRNW